MLTEWELAFVISTKGMMGAPAHANLSGGLREASIALRWSCMSTHTADDVLVYSTQPLIGTVCRRHIYCLRLRDPALSLDVSRRHLKS